MSRNRIIPYNPNLRAISRTLRKNSTLAEILLWEQIRKRKLGVQFHRQVPMDQFVVDFYCHEIMLAIEIDGSSHDNDQGVAIDKYRQKRLEGFGVQFIRIQDENVKKDLDGVVGFLRARVAELVEEYEENKNL